MLPSGEQIAIATARNGRDHRGRSDAADLVKGGLSVIEGFAGEEVPTGRGTGALPVAEP